MLHDAQGPLGDLASCDLAAIPHADSTGPTGADSGIVDRVWIQLVAADLAQREKALAMVMRESLRALSSASC